MIVDLAAGTPSFPTPAAAMREAMRAIDMGYTRYTPPQGIPELRHVLAERYAAKGLSLDESRICVGAGARHLINVVLRTLVTSRDDEVLIPTPDYPAFESATRLAGGTPIFINTHGSDFKVTQSLLRRHLTARTCALVLSTPGNPTGAVYSLEEFSALLAVLRPYQRVHILIDETYDNYVYTEPQYPSAGSVCSDENIDRIILINSMSKTFGMSGWRVGYSYSSAPLARQITALVFSTINCVSSISQWAAWGALMYGEEDATRNRHLAGRLSNMVADTLADLPGITFKAPAGGLYYFIDCREIVRKSTGHDQIVQFDEASLVDILATRFDVYLQSGSTYRSPGFLRLHFAVDERALERGMEQLARGVRQLMSGR